MYELNTTLSNLYLTIFKAYETCWKQTNYIICLTLSRIQTYMRLHQRTAFKSIVTTEDSAHKEQVLLLPKCFNFIRQ